MVYGENAMGNTALDKAGINNDFFSWFLNKKKKEMNTNVKR